MKTYKVTIKWATETGSGKEILTVSGFDRDDVEDWLMDYMDIDGRDVVDYEVQEKRNDS